MEKKMEYSLLWMNMDRRVGKELKRMGYEMDYLLGGQLMVGSVME